MNNYSVILIVFFILIWGCNSPQNQKNPYLHHGEGYVEVNGGKIWYAILGEGDQPPILCLHGGPGGNSASYYNLSELSKERPIIMFDQLGTGRSDHHQDTSLLKVDLFVEQVEAVKSELKLNEYYLTGGSWGAALALEYYEAHPEGIKGIIFNSPYFSTPIWTEDADKLVAALPDSIKAAIYEAERDSLFNTPAYDAANTYFASLHGRRKEKIKHAYDTIDSKRNTFIYNYMWGPSEFTATGTLRNYDNHQSLKKVNVPALFTTGEFDEARPETVEKLSKLVPDSKFVVIPDAGHSTLNDNGKAVRIAIKEFINNIENE
ncbi:proline iminopeptidase-family hydrolase [Marinigracilibium pacificum]|uniref:Proline iminopeptidase-family hydrolase n=1 Tax=Marinigracilibium pacificum TaxID=2729599 RepID=A0A848J0L5_9BACT|nr:proline iminopeptidase-family hydrolase [Marinigracilibium pacificum]NMM47819.1 proline iminopeptidase-family hydrolase [Marinigracilibium pacificum]